MVYAVASIAFLSFIVWAHHMFTVGMPLAGAAVLHAVHHADRGAHGREGVQLDRGPCGRVRCRFEPPMLFALAFLFLFTIGGFSGLMLAIVPADYHTRNTYSSAHFHYVLVPGAVFGIMAGVYYWLRNGPAGCTTLKLATWHLLAVGDLRERAVLPAALPGTRRYAAPHSRLRGAVHRLEHGCPRSALSASALAQLLFPYIIWKCVRSGERVGKKPGRARMELEWELPSPPPYHSWTTPPLVMRSSRAGAEH